MATLTTKILINRGVLADIPSLDEGELGLATDTHAVYVGTSGGNVLVGPGGVSDGDKGDIVVSSSGTVWTVDSGVITFAKMQAISTDVLLGNDGSGSTVQEITCTAAGRAILDDADASAQRTTLGLAIGTNVQAWDADLDALSALSGTNNIYYRSGANTWSSVTIGSNLSFSGGTLNGNAGSVTSVAMSVPGFLSVAGSPITGSGTFAVTLATQAANTGFFGPTTGADAAPTFRTMVTADIPDTIVTYAKVQNVSATSRVLGRKSASAGIVEECTLSELLDFIGSAAQGDILYRGASTWSRLPAGTAGQLLQTNGSGADPSWVASSATRITGEIIQYTGHVAPSGWLLCDGSTHNVATYPTLAALLFPNSTVTVTIASPCVVTWNSHGLLPGTPVQFTSTTGALPTGLNTSSTYYVKTVTTNTFTLSATPSSSASAINTSGSQSGVHTMYCVAWNTSGFTPGTTFQVPLLTGRVPVGYAWGVGGVSDFYIGRNGGAETHTLVTGEIPAHSHPGSAGNFVTSNAGGGAALAGGTGYQQTATTANTGGGGSHNNLQPYTVLNFIIKT